MAIRRNMSERRGAKFPLHNNIKTLLNSHLNTPLFVWYIFCIFCDSTSFESQLTYQLIKSMINSLKIINWSYDLPLGLHLCMFPESCYNSQRHLWSNLQPGRAFQDCLLKIYEQNDKMISFGLVKKSKKSKCPTTSWTSSPQSLSVGSEPQNANIWDSAPRGVVHLFPCPTFVTKRKNNFSIIIYCWTHSSIHGFGFIQKHLSC